MNSISRIPPGPSFTLNPRMRADSFRSISSLARRTASRVSRSASCVKIESRTISRKRVTTISLPGKNKEQINIRCIIQLAAAEFTERYDCKLCILDSSSSVVCQRRAVKIGHFLIRSREGIAEYHVRQIGQLFCDVRQRSDTQT